MTPVPPACTVNEKTALSHLCLHLEPGDFASTIGSNGAGKSTLMMADGGIVLDVCGKGRAGATVDGLVRRFKVGTGRDLDNDRILLSD